MSEKIFCGTVARCVFIFEDESWQVVNDLIVPGHFVLVDHYCDKSGRKGFSVGGEHEYGVWVDVAWLVDAAYAVAFESNFVAFDDGKRRAWHIVLLHRLIDEVVEVRWYIGACGEGVAEEGRRWLRRALEVVRQVLWHVRSFVCTGEGTAADCSVKKSFHRVKQG